MRHYPTWIIGALDPAPAIGEVDPDTPLRTNPNPNPSPNSKFEFVENVRYRLVFGTAHVIVWTWFAGKLRMPDPEGPRDVHRGVEQVRKRRGLAFDTIDPEIITKAIDDAIHRRPPRW